MPQPTSSPHFMLESPGFQKRWMVGVLIWASTWGLLWALDQRLELAAQAVILLLACALSALMLSFRWTLAVSAVAILVFDVSFIPPRGSWSVNVHHDALLLFAMWVVAWIISALVAQLQQAMLAAQAHAARSESLRVLAQRLNASQSTVAAGQAIVAAASELTEAPCALLFSPEAMQLTPLTPSTPLIQNMPQAPHLLGACTHYQQDGLRLVLAEGHALGAGTGRYEEQPCHYLPIRGVERVWAALLIAPTDAAPLTSEVTAYVQALGHQLGLYLDKQYAEQRAQQASQQAQSQALRTTLLEAIAHDYRTPLATIASATDLLRTQAERLPQARVLALFDTIADETAQLSRIADNTLQLARLESLMTQVPMQWESAEELVGSVVRRVRQRHPAVLLKVEVPPDLPLVRCDATLLVQLLDNLIDNAWKYGGTKGPIEVRALYKQAPTAAAPTLELQVRDHGIGIPPAFEAALFAPFARHVQPAAAAAGSTTTPVPRGTGIGLALCQAIAQVHQGVLAYRAAPGGGALFSFTLPVAPQPAQWAEVPSDSTETPS